MSPFLILFFVVDALLTVGVVLFVLQRRKSAAAASEAGSSNTAVLGIEHMRGFIAFGKEQHERIGEYMRANWSGMPDQLPGVLSSLLERLVQEARAQGLPADRDVLKNMIVASLRAHRIGGDRDVRGALAKVA